MVQSPSLPIQFETFLFIVGLLLLSSVFASKISTKFGIPALIFFIFIGMLTGSEGLGGIYFDNFHLTHDLGIIALVLILFGGGLDTHWNSLRSVITPALSLSTIGVCVTALLVGLASHYLLNLTYLESLLLGSVVASTDAAAVFGVLRGQSLRLKGSLGSLLELESGTNDPMAVFLTIGLTSLIIHPEFSPLALIPKLCVEMVIGTLGGLGLGYLAAKVINRIHLTYDGLYPVFTLACAFLTYGGVQSLGGNGFLAVYIAGLTLGGHNFVHRISTIQFHEGMSWLMQILMFLSLGLLVFPSHLLPNAISCLLIALFLVFIARPIAVFVSIGWIPSISFKEKAFISWVGLRGAVPIILATIPMIEGVPAAPIIFNAVFFIVCVSVLVQGITIRGIAQSLGILINSPTIINERKIASSSLEVSLTANSPVLGKSVVELGLPEDALLILLTRGEESILPRGNTVLLQGDTLLLQSKKESFDRIQEIFNPKSK